MPEWNSFPLLALHSGGLQNWLGYRTLEVDMKAIIKKCMQVNSMQMVI